MFILPHEAGDDTFVKKDNYSWTWVCSNLPAGSVPYNLARKKNNNTLSCISQTISIIRPALAAFLAMLFITQTSLRQEREEEERRT